MQALDMFFLVHQGQISSKRHKAEQIEDFHDAKCHLLRNGGCWEVTDPKVEDGVSILVMKFNVLLLKSPLLLKSKNVSLIYFLAKTPCLVGSSKQFLLGKLY